MNRIFCFFLFLIAFLVMTLYDLYSAFLAAMLLMTAPLLSVLFGYRARQYLSFSLAVPRKVRRREETEAVLTLEGKPVPFLNHFSVSAESGKEGALLPGGKAFSFSLPFSVPHCGRTETGAMHISWTDPFGLCLFRKDFPSRRILVMPEPIGSGEAILKSLSRLQSSDETEHFGAAEYKPGDNPRLINWKVTARTDEVYVRDTFPAESDSLILAADYEEDGALRDIVTDALYSVGLALTGAHRPFRFAWSSVQGVPVLETIRTKEDWQRAVSDFLCRGGGPALAAAELNPTVPLLYLTGNPDPPVSPALSPVIWCASEGARRAALSGKSALAGALGGDA